MHFQRIEMVGQVAHRQRQPHRVLQIHLHIFGYAHIRREVIRVAVLRADHRHILLIEIRRLIGKSVAVLDVRRQRDFLRQFTVASPEQEAIGYFAGQAGNQIGLNHRRRKISQVGAGVVDVTVGILPHVGEEELTRRGGPDAGGELSLPSLRPSRRVQREGRLVLNDLGLQGDHVLLVALQVLGADHQPARHRSFQFQVPSGAVWSEVPTL